MTADVIVIIVTLLYDFDQKKVKMAEKSHKAKQIENIFVWFGRHFSSEFYIFKNDFLFVYRWNYKNSNF